MFDESRDSNEVYIEKINTIYIKSNIHEDISDTVYKIQLRNALFIEILDKSELIGKFLGRYNTTSEFLLFYFLKDILENPESEFTIEFSDLINELVKHILELYNKFILEESLDFYYKKLINFLSFYSDPKVRDRVSALQPIDERLFSDWEFKDFIFEKMKLYFPHFKDEQTLITNQKILQGGGIPLNVWSSHKIKPKKLRTKCKDLFKYHHNKPITKWLMYAYSYNYTNTDLENITRYTMNFDEYINYKSRYIHKENKDYRIQNYKYQCNKAERNDEHYLPDEVHSHTCYINNETFKNFKFNHCLEDHLGKNFYEKSNEEIWDLIFKYSKRMKKGLIELSKKLNNKTQPIILYRGVGIQSEYEFNEQNFPRRLLGFTSCTFNFSTAMSFANKFTVTDTKYHGAILEIEIPPDINMFTTDVSTQILYSESEVVITDELYIEYDFKNMYIEYLRDLLADRNGYGCFYKAVPIIPCRVERLGRSF